MAPKMLAYANFTKACCYSTQDETVLK